MNKEQKPPNNHHKSAASFEVLESNIYNKKSFKYFGSLKNIMLEPHVPDIGVGEIEEIENPSLVKKYLGTVDRWSSTLPNECFFWLMCFDNIETAGGSYKHLIATIRLYRLETVTYGPLVMFQRLFIARTDMTDALTYAPIEIYARVVEEYYKENNFVIERGSNMILFNEKGSQGALLGWIIGIAAPTDTPAINVLHAQIENLEEIEKRYANRMAYTDKSEIDEENPWNAVLENIKSMDKKMEDALSKNKTTVFGDVKITNGDFVSGDKVTKIHNISNVFGHILTEIDKKDTLSNKDKANLKTELSELENALQSTQPNEGFIKKRLQNIKKIAPDIFEVTLSTILNPVSGLGTVVTKIAEKMKKRKEK